jgi:hypothetical protein
MSPQKFVSFRTTAICTADEEFKADWLWTGYIAQGNLTLLTSLWKAGKTTPSKSKMLLARLQAVGLTSGTSGDRFGYRH